MSQIRKYGIATSTFSIALGIGFVMQNGDASAARVMDQHTLQHIAQQATTGVSTNDLTPASMPGMWYRPDDNGAAVANDTADIHNAVFEVPDTSVRNLERMVAPLDDTVNPARDHSDLVETQTSPEVVEGGDMMYETAENLSLATPTDCTPVLNGRAGPAATVQLSLSAPCAGATTVRVHHQGMIFDMRTDARGMANTIVPALAPTAVFMAEVSEGEGSVAVVRVLDTHNYHRAVLQWQGDTGFEIHAREFGAAYSDAGHIWMASSGSVDGLMSGDGGLITRLGDASVSDGHRAEVYSFPAGVNTRAGDVVLSVETRVSEANCGQTLAAQTMQFDPNEGTRVLDLQLPMPDCAYVGEILVLNNMLEDMTLALP